MPLSSKNSMAARSGRSGSMRTCTPPTTPKVGTTLRATGIGVASRFWTLTPTDIRPEMNDRVTIREMLRWSRETVTCAPGCRVEP